MVTFIYDLHNGYLQFDLTWPWKVKLKQVVGITLNFNNYVVKVFRYKIRFYIVLNTDIYPGYSKGFNISLICHTLDL